MGEAIKFIFIGIDVLTFVCMLFYLLRGFRKGIIKSVFDIVIKMVLFGLSLIISKPIADIIINSKISAITGEQTVNDFVKTQVANSLFDGDLVQMESAGLDTMTEDILLSIFQLIITAILTILMFLVVATILRKIVSKIIDKKSEKKLKLSSRFCGMLISFCGFLLMFYILLLPLYGIEEIAQKTLDEASNVSDEYSEPADAITEATSNSIIYKTTTSIGKSKDGYFALPAKRLGNTLKIKLSTGSINIIKDLDPIMSNFGRFLEIKDDFEKATNANEIVDVFQKSDVEIMINCLSKSTIISTLYKPAIDILEANSEVEFIKRYNFDLEKLKNIDIAEDIKNTKNFFESVYDLLQSMDLEKIDDVEMLLSNEEVTNNLVLTLEFADDSKVFKECFPKIVYYHLCESLNESDYAFLKDVITLKYIQNYLTLDVATLCEVYNLINESKIIDEDEEGNIVLIDINVSNNREKVETFIDKCLSLKIIEGNEGLIFKVIIDATDFGSYIKYEDSTEPINFANERPLLKNVILDIFIIANDIEDISIDINNLDEYEEISKKIATLLDDMQKCAITKPYVFAIIDAIINTTEYEITLSEEEKNQILDNTFTTEFEILFDIIKESKTIFGDDLLDVNIDVTTLEGSKISSLMKKASTSVIASKIIGEILATALGPDGLNINPVDEEGNLKYDFSTSDNINQFADIVGNMVDVANSIEQVKNNLTNIDDTNIEELVNSLEKLDEITENTELLSDMIQIVCDNTDLTIDENVDWQKESEIVKAVLNDYKETDDKENYDINNNPELLAKLEESEIVKELLDYFGITED